MEYIFDERILDLFKCTNVAVTNRRTYYTAVFQDARDAVAYKSHIGNINFCPKMYRNKSEIVINIGNEISINTWKAHTFELINN